jgi:menaquinone-dependent protoporphyrinogen IX oxidase
MKTLIIYYSKSGINEKLAQAAAQRLNAQVEKLVDKDRRRGLFGLLRCGFDGARKKDPKDFELVVLATPLWAGHLTPAARTYITQQKDKLNKLVFISISGMGAANKNIMADLEAALGKKPAAVLLLSRNEFHRDRYKDKLNSFISSLSS